MGTGKTTLGRMCAAQLGYTFCDSDHVIEARVGCAVSEIFAREGEARFRERERDVIADLAATPELVIATGGGVVLDPQNVAALRETGHLIFLTATTEVILRRVGNFRSRPLLASAPDPRAYIEAMMAQRLPHYRNAAHCQVDTSGRHVRDIVAEIVMLHRLTQK